MNMTKNIQLISAPADKGKLLLYEDGIFPPLGLLWLDNYLRARGYGVEVIDGQFHSAENIRKMLSAPTIGLSFNILSTDSFDEIAAEAKKRGCTVIAGGQAATPLAWTILANNNNVDYVVRYDGEEALRKLLDGDEAGTIENIVYRRGSEIVENPVVLMEQEKMGLDYRIQPPAIDQRVYWNRFQEVKQQVCHHHHHNKPLSVFTQKGCPMRVDGGGCSFCSRADRTLRCQSPQTVHDEFCYLAQAGADRIEDFSDSFLHDRKWLNELTTISEQRGHWGIPVRVYADTRHINPEVIKLALALKIDGVVLGVESGNETILNKNYKPNSIAQILHSVELLGQAGIMGCPSFVLGLIGETEETVADTIRLAEEIFQRCKVEMAYFSIMTPFPGSKAWEMLLEFPDMRKKYGNTYRFNQAELQQDFLQRFTSLGSKGINFLIETINQTTKRLMVAQRDY